MLSSAILYGAIVVIWAGVLIPRWLRRETPVETEAVEPEITPLSAPVDESAEPAPAEAPVPAPRPGEERARVLRARRRLLGMLVTLAVASGALAVMKLAAWWVVLPPSVMLLGYLVLLREASKADAERRAATDADRRAADTDRRADADTDRRADADTDRRADTDADRRAARVAAPAPAMAQAPAPVVAKVAEVIDITAHVSDPYDQYTDAKRAVGGN